MSRVLALRRLAIGVGVTGAACYGASTMMKPQARWPVGTRPLSLLPSGSSKTVEPQPTISPEMIQQISTGSVTGKSISESSFGWLELTAYF